jgi:hypothetical protein
VHAIYHPVFLYLLTSPFSLFHFQYRSTRTVKVEFSSSHVLLQTTTGNTLILPRWFYLSFRYVTQNIRTCEGYSRGWKQYFFITCCNLVSWKRKGRNILEVVTCVFLAVDAPQRQTVSSFSLTVLIKDTAYFSESIFEISGTVSWKRPRLISHHQSPFVTANIRISHKEIGSSERQYTVLCQVWTPSPSISLSQYY